MASKSSSPLKRTFVTILKYGAYAGLVGLVALIVAVGIAMSQLPSYSELVRRDDLGQMIRVRANDGTVIVSLGPSFGEWLSFDEIPPIMREAMVAVEDRRFRSDRTSVVVGTRGSVSVGLGGSRNLKKKNNQ